MKISEALEVANDIRNGCRNVGEADAIVALADAIEVMSTVGVVLPHFTEAFLRVRRRRIVHPLWGTRRASVVYEV